MDLVNFILIGAMKSGTSYIANNLEAHPEISFSRDKEPHYFSKYNMSLEEYHQLFDFSKAHRGEASTTYSFYPEFNKDVAADIYKYNPEMKLIYIVREPFDRITSDYMHLYTRKYTHLEFNQAIKKIPGIIHRTQYKTQLQKYLKFFDREQILLLQYEELSKSPERCFKRITDFLNIAEFEEIDRTLVNSSLHSNKTSYRFNQIPKPLLHLVSALFPSFIKRSIKQVFFKGRQLHEKPVLNEASKAYIVKELSTEMEQLHALESSIDYRFNS